MKNWSHIALVILVSISIVTPSVISFYNDHHDIEFSTDLGEEDTKEKSEKELEEKDTFLEIFVTPALAVIENVRCSNDFYSLRESSFTAKIHLPPPKLDS